MHFLPCPQHAKHSDSDNVWTTHAKIAQNMFTFPQISHLSSNRRVRNLAFYFQFTTLARKLTHRMKLEHVWMQKYMNFRNAIILRHFRPEKRQNHTQKDTNFRNAIILRHFRPEKCQNPTKKDTNFGNAIILHYLGPENRQIQPRKTRISHKTALIDPSKNAKGSIHFSRISHTV